MNAIAKINEYLLNPLITLLFAVAVIYFLYGLFVFIRNQDNDEAQTAGKMHMLWGVVGIFLMMAVGGILEIIEGSANFFNDQFPR